MSCIGQAIPCLPVCLGGSADPRWQHVYVKERDAHGNFKMNREHVTEELVLHYLENRETGELYLYDQHNTAADVTMKSLLIGIFTPFYACAVVAVALARIIMAIATVAIDVFSNLGRDFIEKGLCEMTCNFFYNLGSGLAQHVWPPVRQILLTPLHVIGMEVGSVVGLVCPFEGREIIARVQTSWFDGATYRNDPRYHSENRRQQNDQEHNVNA